MTRDALDALVRRVAGASWASVASVAVVACSSAFVFLSVKPGLVLTENTPTGGDMGSHVWGPMFLMREVLPRGQINGWAPDWYAGFPAYQFYMVVPMLAVVLLHVGVRNPLVVLAVPAALAVLLSGWVVPRLHRARWALLGVGLVATLAVVPVPYGVAFKLVAVSGLVSLPVAAWALGRLAGAPFPVPPALALGSLLFIYNLEPTLNSGTGNIIGGNLTSTMAGEFSFSISLSLALVYVGCLVRGLRTGRGRAVTAVLLALCGLCHIIPAFYALAATAVALVVWPGRARLRWFLPVGPVAGLLSAFWVLPFAGRAAYVNDMGWEPLPHIAGDLPATLWDHLDGTARALSLAGVFLVVAGAVGAVAALGLREAARPQAIAAGAVLAGLVGVGLARLGMGAVTAAEVGLGPDQPVAEGEVAQTIWSYLRPASHALDVPLVLALVGAVVGIVLRDRIAYLLTALVAIGALGFVFVPDGRLWNARVLPLYYLALFLLGALGVAEVVRAGSILLSSDPERPSPALGTALALPATLAVIVFVAGPLGLDELPTAGTTRDGKPTLLGIARDVRNPGSGWAEFNFRGLEGQQPRTGQGEGAAVPDGQGGWPELRHLIATMDRLGDDPEHGCGRAHWEFSRERLTSYGTTMSLMMLPYFTDGCIGSMEGLYFESSATTPHHFITQCKLSRDGSCSQRDLAYTSFDLDVGLQQIALLGVRYYIAESDVAVQAASASDRLTEVAVSGPWHVYELDADASQLVVGLDSLPVVLEGVGPEQDSWLDPAIAWFNEPQHHDVPFAIDGPDEWPRVELPDEPWETEDGGERRIGARPLPELPRTPVRRAEVTDIEVGVESVRFRVDEPGTPVLVKVSAFPNWQAEGAEGPWRVSPNLMVVVPTDDEVVLRYGRTPLDWAAYLLTALGVLAALGLWRLGPVPIPEGLLDRRRREQEEAWAEAEAHAAAAAAAAWAGGPPRDGPEPADPSPGDDPPPVDRPRGPDAEPGGARPDAPTSGDGAATAADDAATAADDAAPDDGGAGPPPTGR